jgi:acyl-CoA synthetase (AMP-forming)/AMP-acid ligase II
MSEVTRALLDRIAAFGIAEALTWHGMSTTYAALHDLVRQCRESIARSGIARGTVVALEADFSPMATAMLLALAEHEAVLVPLTESVRVKKHDFLRIAQAGWIVTVGEQDLIRASRLPHEASHDYYRRLRDERAPGLVLFSSGSTGESKAAVHHLGHLLSKFLVHRPARRMISFLLFDHIGGFNTLLYSLSNGGCLVIPADRSPHGVVAAIAQHRAEVLPTSPTFLRLLLLSEAWRGRDLSSLRLITYGTEPMPESTLRRLREVFPQIELQQTYGLSEIGILRSKSKSSDSLWMKIGGEGFETRIVDGLLEVKARSAMLGYLNAPSPFTADGWFRTGDLAERDGEYFRIVGRRSEIINVGGEKVHPAEVESVIQELDDVADATVRGVANAITGQAVWAKVILAPGVEAASAARRIRMHCSARLERFKVPVKIEIVADELHSERFKKRRV